MEKNDDRRNAWVWYAAVLSTAIDQNGGEFRVPQSAFDKAREMYDEARQTEENPFPSWYFKPDDVIIFKRIGDGEPAF